MEGATTTNVQEKVVEVIFSNHSIHITIILHLGWQLVDAIGACAAFQRSVFGRSTTGNDIVATIFIFFFPIFFSVATFSHRRSARIKKLI